MSPPFQRSSLVGLLLRYPLFILIALAVATYAIWTSTHPAAPPSPPSFRFSTPTEADRPALKAALAPALKAFYAAPTHEAHLAALEAIENYRRSFPGTSAPDYLPPNLLLCEPRDCAGVRIRHLSEVSRIETEIAASLAHLTTGSLEHRAATAEALTLDPRVPLGKVSAAIIAFHQGMEREPPLLAFQAEFFRLIDDAFVFENYLKPFDIDKFRGYLHRHTVLSLATLRPVPASRCADATCESAIAAYNTFEKEHLDALRKYWTSQPLLPGREKDPLHKPFVHARLLAKAAALKKLIADRRAPHDFIREKLGFQVR